MPIEDQWRMIIPDFKGDAHVHNVREGALDHLPMPNEENSVAPIGHYRTEPEEKE